MSDAVSLLAAFGKSIGIDGLAFDDGGGCSLGFDSLAVQLTHLMEAGQLLACAPLAHLPDTGAEPLLRVLLSANVAFRGTQGATLGADPDTGLVTLSYALSLADCDEVRFTQVLKNFVQIADEWQHRIESAQPTTPAEVPDSLGMRV